MNCGRLFKARGRSGFRTVPTLVPSPHFFHGVEDIRVAGVHVSLRRIHVGVTRQDVKNKRVHILPRDARVPKGV